MNPRLEAVLALTVPAAREDVGLHAYDGLVQDLSPAGVRAGLAALGGEPLADPHDEAHLGAFEDRLRVELGELVSHRWNPLLHIDNLDLANYDRAYAPAEERADARRRHLAAWPDAVDAAVEALDRVPRDVARGLLGAAAGLADGLHPEQDALPLAAQQRLVDHLRRAAVDGPRSAGLGGAALARLLATAEATAVDLGRLAEAADAERDRLRAMLREACAALQPDASLSLAVAALTRDHGSATEVLAEARALAAEVIAFTRDHGLVPDYAGDIRVGPTPPSRSWAFAMLSPAAPFEPDGPSWFHVTSPDPAWPPAQQDGWLAAFNRAALPALVVHEVAPGHFTHFRFVRAAPTDVRRALHSYAFTEGWAHDMEEFALEAGYRSGDPRFVAGVALEALVRVTRLAAAIGVHDGALTVAEAERRFVEDAYLEPSAARSEALRATFDPAYGSYTWGKLELRCLRAAARRAWGAAYTHRRFHARLLALGAPPLGLAAAALAPVPDAADD
jgi:hypothetical protein